MRPHVRLLLCCLLMPCLLTGCLRYSSKYRQMEGELLRADSMNQHYVPFTTDTVMRKVVDYFDYYGTPDQRMHAYYLLGCAYRDLNEAPQALENFHFAASLADTTSRDCDFLTLSRIHGQTAWIFYDQYMPMNALEENRKAYHYAVMAKDTLGAILFYAHTYEPYQQMQMADSVVYYLENGIRQLREAGHPELAPGFYDMLILHLTKLHRYEDARHYIQLYEEVYDPEDYPAHYYATKGTYYTAFRDYPAASDMFYRSLAKSTSISDSIAPLVGLLEMYKQKDNLDSIAKYAELCYLKNGAAFGEAEIEKLQNIQSLYNYERYKFTAERKSHQAARMKAGLVFMAAILAVLMGGFLWYRSYTRIKRRDELERMRSHYQHQMERLKSAQSDLDSMKTMSYERQIQEKLDEIQGLKQEIVAFQMENQKKESHRPDSQLIAAPVRQAFQRCAQNPVRQKLEAGDWEQLRAYIDETFPNFYPFVNSGNAVLREDEYHICMLIRMHFKPKDICNIMGLPSANVAIIRRRLLTKIFGIEGTGKELDERILQIV